MLLLLLQLELQLELQLLLLEVVPLQPLEEGIGLLMSISRDFISFTIILSPANFITQGISMPPVTVPVIVAPVLPRKT